MSEGRNLLDLIALSNELEDELGTSPLPVRTSLVLSNRGRGADTLVDAVQTPKFDITAAVHWLHMRTPGEWLSG